MNVEMAVVIVGIALGMAFMVWLPIHLEKRAKQQGQSASALLQQIRDIGDEQKKAVIDPRAIGERIIRKRRKKKCNTNKQNYQTRSKSA